MIPFLAVRSEARALAKLIGRSLVMRPQDWKLAYSYDEGVTIESVPSPDIRLTISPRFPRLFDEFHLFIGEHDKDEAEIWLPLLSRIRLRNIVRLFATERGREAFDAESHDA